MQSNRTCFFFLFQVALILTTSPQWDTLNSQAVEQTNSCLKSLKGSLSYMNEKNFMTHCKIFIWYRNSLRRKQLESQGVAM